MSSSEDEEDEEELNRRVEKLVAGYDDVDQRNVVARRLADELRQQAHSCIICIERVQKTDAVWNCRSCRTPYHLQCMQRWARENAARLLINVDDDHNNSTTTTSHQHLSTWVCPKCRFEYQPREIPTEYRCFCAKMLNPKSDPWLVPHSCGDVCGRAFKCGHSCLILCHPGPCPPCPKMVRARCFCQKSDAVVRRCFNAKWSCAKVCNKVLTCSRHRCSLLCHDGQCETCAETFERRCLCSKSSTLRPCAEESWSCGVVCGKPLTCGAHTCGRVCHDGSCKPCTDDKLTCPCGKTQYSEGNCIDALKCCGDTCGKLLDCKVHECAERCHRGPCSPCNQWRTKKCRCGLKEKQFGCGKEFLCEVKCKLKRQCGKHACNRRCCDSDCPPCEQICGRTLECGNHKCPQPCHRGPCFPCPLISEVKCRCGRSVIKVPCGHERKTRPPRCRNTCQTPPVCRHPSREPHRCHFGDCPPCRQICDADLKCGHKCQTLCHTGLLLDVNRNQTQKAATPWEKLKPKFELVHQPCPPCRQSVPVTCLGAHETGSFQCYEAKPYSCGRQCGRSLTCGNHKCSVLCHDFTKTTCQQCDVMCKLPRPEGCSHQCSMPCHPAPCPKCRQMNRMSCHCGLNQKYVPCQDWCSADEQRRVELLSCGNQCPKLMSCGHRCTLLCHKGPCSEAKSCLKKAQIRCPCGRLSSKVVCSKSVDSKLTCDVECAKILADAQEASERKVAAESQESVEDAGQHQVDAGGVRRRRKNKRRRGEDEEEEKGHLLANLYSRSPFIFVLSLVVFIVVLVFGGLLVSGVF